MHPESDRFVNFSWPAAMPIKALTPSAWGGHIPFMFCLMNFLKPSQYVELGTHYGASFFAACQAIEEFKIDCLPVAIDLWLGDEHAGYYGEEVYSAFKWVHQNTFRNCGRVLRKDFTEASGQFEDKSLDLIHIDGLHTYEAVKNDYETWLPKVSGNGVMLFHDTEVRERGFGVWQLWDEIKNKHASFNFSHTHGLGIIALGCKETNPMVALLEAVNGSKQAKESFESFFRLIGELSVREALARIRLEGAQGQHNSLRGLVRRARAFLRS